MSQTTIVVTGQPVPRQLSANLQALAFANVLDAHFLMSEEQQFQLFFALSRCIAQNEIVFPEPEPVFEAPAGSIFCVPLTRQTS